MQHNESILQRQAIRWFRLQYPAHVLFAIPNGGQRNKTEAAIMKAEGVLAGAADLFLMCSSRQYNGMCIELKTEKGRQTESQKWFEKKAYDFGYCYKVVRSFDEFVNEVNNYLK